MKKLVILFAEREISIVTDAPYQILLSWTGRIRGLEVSDSARAYLQYVDWRQVLAVLEYDVVEHDHEKEGAANGQEAG